MTSPLKAILIAALMAASAAAAGCIEPFGSGADVEPNGTDDNSTDGSGGSDGNATGPSVVNDAPVARISIHNDVDPKNTTTRGFKGDVLVLNGTNSTDEDGYIVAWKWEVFEPAGGDLPPEPTVYEGDRVGGIVFGTEGVKIIKLTVTDNLGGNATTTTSYYRDVSYSYGDQFHWSGPLTETIVEEREHKLPVLAGAAIVAARIVVDGAKAEIALFDPSGTEHVRGVTETDNVTITMDHGAPEAGDWTIKVTITYTPETCEESACLPVAVGHDADYGLDGVVWYGEAPEELTVDDGHGHEH